MKKIIALGTVATVSLVTVVAGATAAFAAPSTLTAISYSPNTGTLSTPIEEVINGGIGTANLTGCMVKLANGVEVFSTDMTDQSLASSFNTPDGFGFTIAPTSGTTVYTTNFYNDIACSAVTVGDVPISGSYTMLPDASYSFDNSLNLQQGNSYVNKPASYIANNSFNWSAGGQFTVSSSSPNPLPTGLTFSGSSVSGAPSLTFSGSANVTGFIPVEFVLSDNQGNSVVATLTINVSAAPTATVNSNINLVANAASLSTPVDITTTGFDWSAGGVMSLDTTTPGCDAIPSGLSFTGDFWDGSGSPVFSAAGVAPAINLTGVATTAGTNNLCLFVEDFAGNYAIAPFSVIISAPIVTPTVATSVSSLSGVVGTAVNSSVTLTTGGDFDWSNSGTVVSVTGLPTGVTATPVLTGNQPTSINFSGTPTAVESPTVTITVTDALGGTASTTLAFSVTAAPTPTPADTTANDLAYTGAVVLPLVAIGAFLLMLGAAVMFIARTRKANS